MFLQRLVEHGFSLSLKTYLLASQLGNFSKGAMGTPLAEWNQVGIIVDMETSPFEYRKKSANDDLVTEDALRDECTKYVLYGTVEGVVAERLDEIIDRNMMNYHMCALKPLDEYRMDIIDHDEEHNESSSSPSLSSQKYRARCHKANASSIKSLSVHTDEDDNAVDLDNGDERNKSDEVDILAEDFRRSARQKAIREHNELENNVDSLLRTRYTSYIP